MDPSSFSFLCARDLTKKVQLLAVYLKSQAKNKIKSIALYPHSKICPTFNEVLYSLEFVVLHCIKLKTPTK